MHWSTKLFASVTKFVIIVVIADPWRILLWRSFCRKRISALIKDDQLRWPLALNTILLGSLRISKGILGSKFKWHNFSRFFPCSAPTIVRTTVRDDVAFCYRFVTSGCDRMVVLCLFQQIWNNCSVMSYSPAAFVVSHKIIGTD